MMTCLQVVQHEEQVGLSVYMFTYIYIYKSEMYVSSQHRHHYLHFLNFSSSAAHLSHCNAE